MTRIMDPRVEELMPVIRSFGLDRPTIPEIRAAFARAAAEVPLPEGLAFARGTLAGMAALHVRPEGSRPARRILYFHGGGYVFGGIEAQKGMACRLALATGLEVVQPEYRLAPEHPCPAAVEDAAAAYRALLEEDQDAGDALTIAYPLDGVAVDLGTELGEPTPLAIKVRNGEPPFTFFANGMPIGRKPFARNESWQPDGPGFVTLSVVDAEGKSDRVTVIVQ